MTDTPGIRVTVCRSVQCAGVRVQGVGGEEIWLMEGGGYGSVCRVVKRYGYALLPVEKCQVSVR